MPVRNIQFKIIQKHVLADNFGPYDSRLIGKKSQYSTQIVINPVMHAAAGTVNSAHDCMYKRDIGNPKMTMRFSKVILVMT